MFSMPCGQHLLLPVVPGQFEDPPKPNDQKNKTEATLLRRQRNHAPHQKSAQDLKLESCQEMTIVEHTSDTGNPNNGEDDEDQTAPLGRGTTAGGGDDDGYNSSLSSGRSSSGSSVHSHRSIRKPKKKVKKIKKRTDRGKTSEQQFMRNDYRNCYS